MKGFKAFPFEFTPLFIFKLTRRLLIQMINITSRAKNLWHFTVKAGQAYLQDSINELTIWKMNPLVVPVTSVKFKSAFLLACVAAGPRTRLNHLYSPSAN